MINSLYSNSQNHEILFSPFPYAKRYPKGLAARRPLGFPKHNQDVPHEYENHYNVPIYITI
jgi:hypothetical protein